MVGILSSASQLGDEVLQVDVGLLQVQRVDDNLDELEEREGGPSDEGGEAAGEGSGEEEVGAPPHRLVHLVLGQLQVLAELQAGDDELLHLCVNPAEGLSAQYFKAFAWLFFFLTARCYKNPLDLFKPGDHSREWELLGEWRRLEGGRFIREGSRHIPPLKAAGDCNRVVVVLVKDVPELAHPPLHQHLSSVS